VSDLVETRLNGTIYSATSCSWVIALAPYVGIVSLDYEEKRERKLVHASRRDGTPLGMTSGKYSVGSFSMTMLRSSFQRLAEQLTALGAGSYGDARFPVLATYSEPLASIAGVKPIVIDIQGCAITGVKDSFAEGFEELLTEVQLSAISLTRNGLRLWSVVNGVGQ
jgi:hypothetical protein